MIGIPEAYSMVGKANGIAFANKIIKPFRIGGVVNQNNPFKINFLILVYKSIYSTCAKSSYSMVGS